jgi:6-phosphofructokinase
MIATKTVIVNGEYRIGEHGAKVYDLAAKIDQAIQDAIKTVDGDVTGIDVPSVRFPTAADGGSALIQLVYNASTSKSHKADHEHGKGGK